jgi:hypothetical protein
MARTPEGKVKASISKLLNKYVDKDRLLYWMPVPSGYGTRQVDYIGCHKGTFFSIEAKAPGGKTTPLQEQFLSRVDEAGGVFFVIDGEGDDNLLELKHWLDRT